MIKLLFFATVVSVLPVFHLKAQVKIIQPSSNNYTSMVLGKDNVPLYEAKLFLRGISSACLSGES